MGEPLAIPEICGCEESEYLRVCVASALDGMIKVTKGVESFLIAIDNMMVDMLGALNYDSYANEIRARDAIQPDNAEMDNND